MRRTATSVGLALALTGTVVFGYGSTAFAGPPTPTAKPTVVTIKASDLLGAPQRLLTAAPKAKAEANAFALDQARQGRTVDSAQMWTAAGTDPVNHRPVSVVWENSYRPQEFRLAQATGADATANGYGVAMADNSGDNVVADAASGFGFSSAVSWSGMYRQNQGCSTATFDAWYSSTNHSLTTCFEKYAQSGTNVWVYNRWALFSHAPEQWWETFWPTTNEFTIRSRPWKGQESKVWQLGPWQPQVGGASCSDIGNFQLSGGGAQVTIPIHQCDHMNVQPDANQHSMAVQWLGSTGEQRWLDFAMVVYAKDNKVIPTYADYSWAIVNTCTSPPGNCTVNEVALLKDSGW